MTNTTLGVVHDILTISVSGGALSKTCTVQIYYR